MTAPKSEAARNFDQSLTSWAPVALGIGALWALLGVRSGFVVTHYFALASGGALTAFALLCVASAFRHSSALLAAVPPAAAVSWLVLATAGKWLLDTTHHRPLGAVTFAVFGLVVVGLSLLLFYRRRVPFAVGAALFVSSLGWLAVLLMSAGFDGFLELGVGLLLVVAAFALESRVRTKSHNLSFGCAGALLSCSVLALYWVPSVQGQPLILGLPGLLR